MSEMERVIRDLEPRTRLVETWWVQDERGTIPHSFGSSERECREYQRRNGGELQVTRLWETTVGQIVALDPAITGEHIPECNDRCEGDSHYLTIEPEETEED